jgi:hypothetical protein
MSGRGGRTVPLMTEDMRSRSATACRRCSARRPVPPRRHLISGAVWCQLFSEPEAGSDLASVRACGARVRWLADQRAEVWTTATGPTSASCWPAPSRRAEACRPVHVPGRSPCPRCRGGPSASSTRLTDEVFLSDVFVPTDSLLPPAGGGWKILRPCSTAAGRPCPRAAGRRPPRTDRPARRRKRQSITWRSHHSRADAPTAEVPEPARQPVGAAAAGANPGPVGSLGKLANALTAQRFAHLAWPETRSPGTATAGASSSATSTSLRVTVAKDALFRLPDRRRHQARSSVDHRRASSVCPGPGGGAGCPATPSPAKPSQPPVGSG